MANDFKVTPWEVSGNIDYKKLSRDFGTKLIDQKLLRRIEKHTGEVHPYLSRGYYYSHRDLDLILKDYESGKGFFLYTGRGPSGNMHLGHLTPFLFTKWLQDKFDVNLYVQITDDEKFVFKPKLSLEDTVTQSRTDIADIIALGFKPENTFIMQDTVYKDTYKKALKWAKHINFSTVKAVFGFENSTNIGSIYYPAVQCVPIMFEKKRCLIPAAIDQDNYWRVARDIAHKIDGGYPKPAAIHSKFVPALQGYDTKMSSSVANTAIYLSDTPAEVKKKINKYAFSGGRATVEEHRKKGCNTNVCVVCSYINLFEMDDEKAKDQIEGAASGKYLSGESKKYLIKLINNFLEKHQATKKKVEKKIDKFILQ